MDDTQKAIEARLIALAAADHAAYPQYNGYFDKWKLVKVLRTQKFKGGEEIRQGHYTIASPEKFPTSLEEAGSMRSVSVLLLSLPMFYNRLTSVGCWGDPTAHRKHIQYID